jgi:hypothetical protein
VFPVGFIEDRFDGGGDVAALTVSAAQRLDDEVATRSIRDIAAYLQETVGQRVAAALAGLADAKQMWPSEARRIVDAETAGR